MPLTDNGAPCPAPADLVGVNTPKDWPSNRDCTNITGRTPGDCNNGQAGFYYQQGCFIGCPECDHVSGRRQIDLCGLGKKATINDPMYRSVNRNATAGSIYDIVGYEAMLHQIMHADEITHAYV